MSSQEKRRSSSGSTKGRPGRGVLHSGAAIACMAMGIHTSGRESRLTPVNSGLNAPTTEKG